MSHFVPDLDNHKEGVITCSHSHKSKIYEIYAEYEEADQRKSLRVENAFVPDHDSQHDFAERLLNWMDDTEKPSGSHTHRVSVPALEVPLSNLAPQDDEMLSWLQYPLEDSFDKNYCSEELFTDGPMSHSTFVHDAFSYLTIKEKDRTHPAGLNSLSSDIKRKAHLDASRVTHAQEVAVTPTPSDTNKGKRALAVNAAMAIGAQRAAGLLSQSGVEAFYKVRTNVQPCVSETTHNVLPTTQAPNLTSLNFQTHTFKVGDRESSLQSTFQRLAKPNFPLFSRAVGATRTGLKQVSCNESVDAARARQAFSRHGKEESASKCEWTANALPASFGLSRLQACPSMVTAENLKGFSMSSTQSIASELGSSRLQFEATMQPLVEHYKDGLSALVTESTTTSITPTASCKLERDAVGSTNMELTSSILCTKRRFPSCASGPEDVETSAKQLPSSGVTTTNEDLSMCSELARHDSQTSQNLPNYGSALPSLLSSKTELIAGKELEWGSQPLVTVGGFAPSDKLEMSDATMASPSRGSCDSIEKSTKEAAASTIKRKAHLVEDSEVESKDVEQGNPAPGRAKRSRAAEIHNLSERKRRNKINVKMKALQDLIPNANKTDKASILDEAIEYMKMLQSQVQLMSLRSGMVGLPMLLPPGMQASPMQQGMHPYFNTDLRPCMGFRFDAGSLNRHGLVSPPPALGQPVLGTLYNASGLQLHSSHAALHEAQGQFQPATTNGAHTSLSVQHHQQPLNLNVQTNADMMGAYALQQQRHEPNQQLQAQETPSNAMQ